MSDFWFRRIRGFEVWSNRLSIGNRQRGLFARRLSPGQSIGDQYDPKRQDSFSHENRPQLLDAQKQLEIDGVAGYTAYGIFIGSKVGKLAANVPVFDKKAPLLGQPKNRYPHQVHAQIIPISGIT